MSDEPNPYRFSGDASEEIDEAPEVSRRLTLADLQSLSKGRRLLGAFLVIFVGSCAVAIVAVALAPSPAVHAPRTYLEYAYVGLAASVAALVGMAGLFVVGNKMVSLAARRNGGIATLALLVPGLNAVVATILIRDAKRTLESRGVRVGWIASDFSQARADRSFWRPRVL